MCGFVLLTALGGAAGAQSALPSIQPTALASPDSPAPAPVRAAEVSYQMGQLTVIAENSSLVAILREIAGKVGMKITGGVADQRVYGTYGPAAPSKVLALLLDGSGANMILRENTTGVPVELVLMPTQGMPVTFAPSASQYAPLPQSHVPPQNYSQPQPAQPFAAPQRPPYSQPAVATPPESASQPAGASTTEQTAQPGTPPASNGARTPQQIFEELLRLQQQKAQPPAASR